MPCTCRIVTDYEPYGDGYAARDTFELCDQCHEAQVMAELDEWFAEFNAEEVAA